MPQYVHANRGLSIFVFHSIGIYAFTVLHEIIENKYI